MEESLSQDANQMELMKMCSVMDQVASAGALTRREKKYLKQGLKIKSSALNRVSATQSLLNCFFFLTFIIQYLIIYHFTTLEDPLTSCQKQYQDSWRNPAAGRSVPLCNSDGTYSKVQCYLSTCYCVDTNGNQIKGTSVNSLRDGLPNCDDDPGKFMI